jgi:hypothetical protein
MPTDRSICGVYRWTVRWSSLDTFRPFVTRAHSPRSPAMPRPAVNLGVHHGQLPHENAAVVQGCVPLVITDGQDSYRLAQATAGKGVTPLH